MAAETDIVLLEPRPGFERIHNEICKLVEDRTMGQRYQGGAHLTPSDIATMKIVFDLNAKNGFWAPAGNNRRCALKEIFSNLETLLDDEKSYKKELAECPCPKILDAYGPSIEYSRILQYLVKEGLFYNEAFVDASGDDQFQNLRVAYYRSDIYMETRVVFSSPSHPHITILSIQPQRASSQKELLCTEFWTLYYWAYKLARRGLHTTELCLPMRMVSLCGYEARMVSAVFSLGYPRPVVKEVGRGKYRGVSKSCKIHISEYRDLSVPQNFRDLMEELVASPCGNANVEQKPPEKISI